MSFVSKEDLPYLSLLTSITVIYFNPLIFNPDSIIYSSYRKARMDIIQQYNPWRFYLRQSVIDGGLPLWNPNNFLGQPFVANIQVGVFSPTYILTLILPTHVGFNYTIIVSYIVLGTGVYYLLSEYEIQRFGRLIGSISLIFGSSMTMRLTPGHVTIMSAFALMPWIFLAYQRAFKQKLIWNSVIAGSLVGIQFLGGHPQTTHITLTSVFVYTVVRETTQRKVLRMKTIKPIAAVFSISGLIAFLLSAVQLLPTAYMLQFGSRQSLSLSEIGAYQIPVYELVGFTMPHFTGVEPSLVSDITFSSYYWETHFYIGILPIILSLLTVRHIRLNKNVRGFFAVGIISLLLALGHKHQYLDCISTLFLVQTYFECQGGSQCHLA